MRTRRQRTEYAPRKVENSATREGYERYMQRREKALAEEVRQAKEEKQ